MEHNRPSLRCHDTILHWNNSLCNCNWAIAAAAVAMESAQCTSDLTLAIKLSPNSFSLVMTHNASELLCIAVVSFSVVLVLSVFHLAWSNAIYWICCVGLIWLQFEFYITCTLCRILNAVVHCKGCSVFTIHCCTLFLNSTGFFFKPFITILIDKFNYFNALKCTANFHNRSTRISIANRTGIFSCQ